MVSGEIQSGLSIKTVQYRSVWRKQPGVGKCCQSITAAVWVLKLFGHFGLKPVETATCSRVRLSLQL